MTSEILMPALSDSMQEGTILTWLIEDGGSVETGAELCEIETEKATMTYESEVAGTLSIAVAAGETAAVGEVIARVGESAGESASGTDAGETPAVSGEPVTDPPDAAPATNGNRNGSGAAVPATPMARRIAGVHGVDLTGVSGSGPRGRIVRADVERAAGLAVSEPPVARSRPAPAGRTPPAPVPSPARGGTAEELTRLQRTIARRMAESTATVPHFQVQTEVEMTAALAFRAQLKALCAVQERPVPSLNDLIVKACAVTLHRFPRANGSYAEDRFVLHEAVNVGFAVAARDALVVPVVANADRLGLGAIATRTRELAAAVRDGTVTPAELSGATFTVSNLGMFGMTAISPVIDPPQAAILGVGAIRPVLARGADGTIVDEARLTLTLSCDHRILYGADAAAFLSAVRETLESPAGLAL